MFLRYFAPLYEPIRWIRNKWIKGSSVVGKVRVDVHRVKAYKSLARYEAGRAKDRVRGAKNKAKAAKVKAGAMKQKWSGTAQPPPAALAAAPAGAGGGPVPAANAARGGNGAQLGAAGMPRYAAAPAAPAAMGPGPAGGPAAGGGPGEPAAVNGTNGIVVAGALWWKKHLCASCGQQLDKTWDRCPYCSVQAVAAAPQKTQAIMVDPAGIGSGFQLLGWLVSIKGAQRGELYTLQPVTSIGSDPTCTVVLTDGYMSAKHAEIKAEGGVWILRDLKSTNGTYVNDKRIEHHELVDSDFIRFGQSVVKFKSL